MHNQAKILLRKMSIIPESFHKDLFDYTTFVLLNNFKRYMNIIFVRYAHNQIHPGCFFKYRVYVRFFESAKEKDKESRRVVI